MNNQEAIEFLKNMIDREAIGFVCHKGEGDVSIWQYHIEALQMAISALQAQEVKQEAKDSTESSSTHKALDTISRQAAIDAVSDLYWMDERLLNFKKEIDATFDKIMALPSAQPEREKGKWTKDCACEICGFKPWYERDIHTLSFCPNCGADMREDQDGKSN